MVDQTQVNGAPPATEGPQRAVARNTAELMSGVLTLAELQGRLLLVDIESGIGKMLPLAVTLLAGLVLAGSCLPIAMATLALALVEYVRFSPAQAFALALLGGAVLSLLLVVAAIWQLRAGLRILDRSQTEWKQNIRWLKSALQRMDQASAQHGSYGESRWL